jgi:hypothetical protein
MFVITQNIMKRPVQLDGAFQLYVTQVLHNWKGVTYWCAHSFRKKKGPITDPHMAHHTTTLTSAWLQRLTRDFLQMNYLLLWDIIYPLRCNQGFLLHRTCMEPIHLACIRWRFQFTKSSLAAQTVAVFVNCSCIMWVQIQLLWCISCCLHRYA